MLFSGFCFVLSFCTFYSAAAKWSRSVARRACPSRRYSLHIAPLTLPSPPPPLCPAPPTLPTSSGSSFLGELNTAATAALASPGLISQKIMSWISSHSHPTVVHSSQIVPSFFFFPFFISNRMWPVWQRVFCKRTYQTPSCLLQIETVSLFSWFSLSRQVLIHGSLADTNTFAYT